jgi:predicted transposase YbfD/YdcC
VGPELGTWNQENRMAASSVGSIKKHFRKVMDPRVVGRTDHMLVDVLVMAICGVIANCDNWGDIVLFAQQRRTWFQRFLKLPNGIPSQYTFRRIFDQLDPRTFQHCFVSWVKEISDLVGLKHIAIDGKTLRHSGNKKAGLRMLHSVSAWAAEQHLLLGQVMTDAKSNEITAIPKLLELLDLHGVLVTIDAMGCQKAVAKQIVDQKGDYVLTLKANQGNLLEDVQATVEKALEGLLPVAEVEQYTSVDTAHGRHEERTYTVIHNVEGIRDRDSWAKLTSVGMIYSERTVDGHKSMEVRYFIGSKKMGARKYARVLRGHWAIENNLHWQLDITFGEDDSRIEKRNAGANFAALRRIAISLLKQNPRKDSLGRKRMAAALDPEFLAEILTGAGQQDKV